MCIAYYSLRFNNRKVRILYGISVYCRKKIAPTRYYTSKTTFPKIAIFINLWVVLKLDSPNLSLRPMHWEMCGNWSIFRHFLLFPLLISPPPAQKSEENFQIYESIKNSQTKIMRATIIIFVRKILISLYIIRRTVRK